MRRGSSGRPPCRLLDRIRESEQLGRQVNGEHREHGADHHGQKQRGARHCVASAQLSGAAISALWLYPLSATLTFSSSARGAVEPNASAVKVAREGSWVRLFMFIS